MRAIVRRFRPRASVLFHVLTVLSVLAGLLAPLVPAGAFAQAAPPPPIPAPSRATVTGDFQALLGCPFDGDPACPQTELRPTGSNVFSAFLPVPAGEWRYRVAVQADREWSLGENGDPNGPDIRLQVPEGSAGAVFTYDANTGEIAAAPSPANVEVVTDTGDRIPLEPEGDGFRATFDADPGTYGVQVLVDGQPVAQDTIQLDQPERVVFETDAAGNVVNKDIVETASLRVDRAGEDGQPLPGSCFGVFDGNVLLGQGCDESDGAADGETTILFPEGVDARDGDLRETRPPGGEPAVAPRQVELANEDLVTSVAPEGAQPGGEQPAEEPTAAAPAEPTAAGNLTVDIVSGRGNPLPGACVAIIELGAEACDDDGDGTIAFEGVPPGAYTLRQTRAPEGRQPLPDLPVEVGPDGGRVTLTHQGGGQGEPQPATEVPTEPQADAGSLELTVTGPDGAPAAGGCYALVRADTGERIEACDADLDGDNGLVSFNGIPAGVWRLEETATPPGFSPASPQDLEIRPGETIRAAVTLAPAETAPAAASLAIGVTDEAGNPLPGACVALSGPVEVPETCDDGTGRIELRDLPAGEYAVRQTRAADGFEPAGEQRIVLDAGQAAALSLVNRQAAVATEEPIPTETPAPEPGATAPAPGGEPTPAAPPADATTGSVAISAVDAAGSPAAGGCYALLGATFFNVCDGAGGDADPAGGAIRIDGVAPGQYDLFETQPPPGVDLSSAGITLDVAAGATTQVRIAPGAVPEIVEVGQPSGAPTPAPDAGQRGGVEVTILDPSGALIDGACLRLDGPTPANRLCDGLDGDGEAAPGVVVYEGMEPGDYTLEILPPEGFSAPEPQPFSVQPGEIARVQVTLQPAAPGTGDLEILALGPDGELAGGACFAISGPAAGTANCDDDPGSDGDPTPGRVLLTGLPEGQYMVSVSRAPIGYAQSDQSVNVTIAPGAPAQAEFRFEPEPAVGSLLVSVTREGGIAPGFCVESLNSELRVTPVCDNGEGDADPAEDRVLIENVTPGTYAVVVVSDDPNAAPPSGQDVTIAADAVTELAVTISPAGTGTVLVTLADDAGQPVAFCAELRGAAGTVGPVCDGSQEDGDPAPGAVSIGNVAVGDWEVATSDLPVPLAAPAPQPVTVLADQATTVSLQVTRPLGSLVLVVQDDQGALLPSTCVTLTGPDGVESQEFCDAGDDGRLNFPDLVPGTWTVRQTRAAQGFQPAPELTVEVAPGAATEQVVTLAREGTPTPEPTATPEATATPEGTPAPEPTATPEPSATEAAQPAVEPTQGPGVAPVIPAVPPTPTPEPANPGTLVVVSIAPDGTPLAIGGACYELSGPASLARVCDDGGDDADPAPGSVRIEGVPAGSWTVSQVRSPEGYRIARSVRARVEPDQEATASVVNEPVPAATGSLLVTTADPGGDLLGGACYRLVDSAGAPVRELCDGDREDTASRPGAVGIAGIDAGNYTVEQSRAPEGFEPAAAQGVEVVGDAETPLSFANQPLAPETGTVTLQAVDEDGQPVEGQCFLLSSDGDQRGPICDNGEGDADAAPGTVVVNDLPVGAWEAAPQLAEADAAEQRFAPRRNFTLRRGGRPINVVLNVRRQRPTTGDLVVTTRNERNQPLGGACYEVGASGEVCDNDRRDGDTRLGQVALSGLPEGEATLVQTRQPAGYEPAADQTVRIRGGQARQASVRNAPRLDRTGELRVRTVDRDGNAVSGACYQLISGTRRVGPSCDDARVFGRGETVFEDLPAGSYVVRQTRAPEGHTGGNDAAVRVLGGETAEVTVTVAARPGSLLIRKSDTANVALGGACFEVISDDGRGGYDLCDNDPSDANRADGLILLEGVAPGDYTVRESRAPSGYTPSGDVTVSVSAGARATVTVRNTPLPPPPRRGDLVVTKTDVSGALLPGACFALLDRDTTIAGPRCDGDDGSRDGLIRFRGAASGEWTLRETQAPSAIWQPSADSRVTIQQNQVARVTVENALRPGRVLVRKTDPNGDPLANACFDLDRDAAGELCTDANGRALFVDVPVGVYRLTETRAPDGFLATAPLTNVQVNPGATTVLDVVNEAAPPAPGAGSMQLVKFICPAGEQGEFTLILDSTRADGSGKLGQTAGCVRGDARFRLESLDGAITPFELSTGGDGRYLVSLREGRYRLTEVAPDLPGEAVTDFIVGANQLTTLVVLNYVAPPAPAPGQVEVVKYTCAPGLQGVTFDDFVSGCAESRALTNNVTFRLNGEIAARRVTGDIGEQGVTRFFNVPPGPYRLAEDLPLGAAQSVFSFCGLDPNAPDLAATGAETRFQVPSGQLVVCYWFDVPDIVSETTGSIVVHKLSCPIGAPPAGYDWPNECAPQGAGVRFALSFFDGERFTAKAAGATGADSTLQFVDAAPGVYQLTEIGAAWCRAESDSVDARGNVIVQAGKRANVWIYNCTGARIPPNTGAGPDAAELAAIAPAAPAVAGVPAGTVAQPARVSLAPAGPAAPAPAARGGLGILRTAA